MGFDYRLQISNYYSYVYIMGRLECHFRLYQNFLRPGSNAVSKQANFKVIENASVLFTVGSVKVYETVIFIWRMNISPCESIISISVPCDFVAAYQGKISYPLDMI